MLVLNTLSILIQVAFIVFMSLVSMNIIGYFSSSVRKMVVLAPAIFVNHGGGPMPLLGDEAHEGLTRFLRNEINNHVNFRDIKAIILVTAHWQENKLTISSGEKHELYFDYYGFVPEAYQYRYDAPGDPELARRIQSELQNIGWDSILDPNRGWDHGVFVPMILMHPEANIPIVQISVLANQDANTHYQLGKALYKFRKEGVAIIGSGMSYHNMFEFIYSRNIGRVVNREFDDFLHNACTSNDEKRQKELVKWRDEPGADDAHPPRAAEHFMPLIVVAGAGGKGPGERIFNWDMNGVFRLSGFIWKND